MTFQETIIYSPSPKNKEKEKKTIRRLSVTNNGMAVINARTLWSVLDEKYGGKKVLNSQRNVGQRVSQNKETSKQDQN